MKKTVSLVVTFFIMVLALPMTANAATNDMYLFGYIEGSDYGCMDDYQNNGEYKFNSNGELSVHFSQDSYIGIKTTDGNWYMTNGYLGNIFDENSKSETVAFYNTNTLGENVEKLFVPANTDLHIKANLMYDTIIATIVYDGEDTTSTDTTSTNQLSQSYCLCGNIDGRDFGIENDHQNTSLRFNEDGTMRYTFEKDSYVMVKTADNSQWFMTNRYEGINCDLTKTYQLCNTEMGSSEKIFVEGGVTYDFTLTETDNGLALTLERVR